MNFWAAVDILGLLDRWESFDDRCGSMIAFYDCDVKKFLHDLSTITRKQFDREKLFICKSENKYRKRNFIEDNYIDDSNKRVVEYSFSYPQVRNRLEMLMGSNVVRLTDRRYMQKLITRIRQDYETSQQERVEKRVTMELMRTKKMILERLIPVQEAPDELRKYPLFQLYLYCDAIIEEKQQKRMPKKVRVTNSLYQLLYPDKNDNDDRNDNEDEDQVYMKKTFVNGAQLLVPMTPEEISAVINEQETHKDIDNGYLLTQVGYDRLYFETDAIKELREMQSVEEMYTKAQEIVGILYSYADEGRYRKAAIDKNDKEIEPQDFNEAETPSGAQGIVAN